MKQGHLHTKKFTTDLNDSMTEIETTRIELKTIKGGIKPPTYDGLLRTKAYIDERSRKEWREKYGEIHEEYVTVQTQVTVDDVSCTQS